MKRYIGFTTIVMSMVLVMTMLLGCNGDSAASKKKEILVAYSQAELVNSWRITNQWDMETQAKLAGVRLISADANQNTDKQLSDVEALLARNPDAIIVSPLGSEALVPIVEMCDKAKVPLFVIDRTINVQPGAGMYISEIAQSHITPGALLAQKAVALLTQKYGEPRGNVVHIRGHVGASPDIDATLGWNSVMKNYPKIKTIATEDGYFTKQGGRQVMEKFLKKYPKGKIDIVRSDYSDMTLGAIEAINAANRKELLGYILGRGGHIDTIRAVIAKDIAMEAQVPPYFGQLAIQSVLSYLAGDSVPARQEIPTLVFESDKPEKAQNYLLKIEAVGMEF